MTTKEKDKVRKLSKALWARLGSMNESITMGIRGYDKKEDPWDASTFYDHCGVVAAKMIGYIDAIDDILIHLAGLDDHEDYFDRFLYHATIHAFDTIGDYRNYMETRSMDSHIEIGKMKEFDGSWKDLLGQVEKIRSIVWEMHFASALFIPSGEENDK